MSSSKTVFLTGSFELCHDNLTLHVEHGAVLRGSSDESSYPLIEPLPSYGVGRDVPTSHRFRPLIFASNVSGVTLTGGGTIDGNGYLWWAKYFAGALRWSRPRLVEFMFCRLVLIEDLTLENSPFWTVHPYASIDVTVQRLTVTAPWWAPNTDGVDPDSCRNVLIRDCVFSAGDDGVAIKSGLNQAGRDFGVPCENVRIENVTVAPERDNGSTNGVSIGSEMSGGVRNVTVDGLSVSRCAVGVYVKSMEGRGGVVEDITFQNVVADHVAEPVRFAMHYSYRRQLADGAAGMGNVTIPHFRNLAVRNLTARGALVAGAFAGLPGSQITGVTLEDVQIEARKPFSCSHVSGVATRTTPRACFTSTSRH